MEWRLMEQGYEDSLEHAPQLEPEALHDLTTLTLMLLIQQIDRITSIVDLAAGDGRLLAGLPDNIQAWGYDSNPQNSIEAMAVHGVEVRERDFGADGIAWADLCIVPDCLHRLSDPQALVRRISRNCTFVIASAPAYETPDGHDRQSVWAWDLDGFEAMFTAARYKTLRHSLDPEGYGTQVFVGERM